MKLFKKKDKNIEAEEILAKNAESAKTATDGKNAGAAQETKEDVPETIVCPKCGTTICATFKKSIGKQNTVSTSHACARQRTAASSRMSS